MKHTVDRWLGGLLVILMGLSVVNVLWQVFSRFILSSPSSFTQETARFLLIWIGVLGAGYAVGTRDHLALELLPERLEGRSRQRLGIGIELCLLLFAVAVFIVGGTRLAYVQFALGQTSASLGLPMGYIYLVLPLSGLAMSFYAIVHLRAYWDNMRRDRTDNSEQANDPDNSKVIGTGI